MASLKIYSKEQTDTLLQGKADTSALATKQDTLVSGTNIKTINNASILGSGDLIISSGSGIEKLDINNLPSDFTTGDILIIGTNIYTSIGGTYPTSWTSPFSLNSTQGTLQHYANKINTLSFMLILDDTSHNNYVVRPLRGIDMNSGESITTVNYVQYMRLEVNNVVSYWNSKTSARNWVTCTTTVINGADAKSYRTYGSTFANLSTDIDYIYRIKKP